MKNYPFEYRCTGCGIRVDAEKRVTLYCVKCQKVLLRWK